MHDHHHLRLASGQALRIDGRAYVVGMITDGGRVFVEKETGVERLLSNAAQINMAREQRITTEAMWNALDANTRECLATDWDAFSPDERDVMQWRVKFVRPLMDLPPELRRTRKAITKVIDGICGEEPVEAVGAGGDGDAEIAEDVSEDGDDGLFDDGRTPETKVGDGDGRGDDGRKPRKRPTVRTVRRWHALFVAGGKDIRILADQSFRKGRDQVLPYWMVEEIQAAIDEVYANRTGGTLADTRRRAVDRIRARMGREGLQLPADRPPDILGVNAIAPFVNARDKYDLNMARRGKAEADRLAERVGEGPQGERPLGAVEIDHTMLDIVVVDEVKNLVLGRPWLTAMIDRYSRCIVGYALSFHPPSWTTVMEALRVAVSDKAPLVAELGGIRGTWDCQGVPEVLVCDNGKEFHSHSMREAEAVLGMRILYLPRKKGWLKGKIERWFKTLEEEIFHKIPGTTLSNVLQRKDYDSEGLAVLTLAQAKWLIGKWTVDVYHQRPHTKTGKPPAVRWDLGVRADGPRPPPPPGLLVPLTGLVETAALRREGVRFKNLIWNSNEFSALRNRIGLDEVVSVRIDPLDLRHAYVLDEDNREWVRGDLQETGPEAGLTLHQYEVVCKLARETQRPDEDRLAALSRARTEIFDYVKKIVKENGRSKAGMRYARFVKDGRKPSEHVAPTVHDPVASAGPLGSHRVVRPAAGAAAVEGPPSPGIREPPRAGLAAPAGARGRDGPPAADERPATPAVDPPRGGAPAEAAIDPAGQATRPGRSFNTRRRTV